MSGPMRGEAFTCRCGRRLVADAPEIAEVVCEGCERAPESCSCDEEDSE